MSSRSKKFAAVGAGCIAAGALAASAASLGTLSVNSLGTTAEVVAACQTSGLALTGWADMDYSGVATATTAPTSEEGSTFNNTGVTLTGIATACSGKTYQLVLAESDGTELVLASGTVSTTPSIDIAYAAVDSKQIEQAILTIYGA